LCVGSGRVSMFARANSSRFSYKHIAGRFGSGLCSWWVLTRVGMELVGF
jgi:hypothetical protein